MTRRQNQLAQEMEIEYLKIKVDELQRAVRFYSVRPIDPLARTP